MACALTSKKANAPKNPEATSESPVASQRPKRLSCLLLILALAPLYLTSIGTGVVQADKWLLSSILMGDADFRTSNWAGGGDDSKREPWLASFCPFSARVLPQILFHFSLLVEWKAERAMRRTSCQLRN